VDIGGRRGGADRLGRRRRHGLPAHLEFLAQPAPDPGGGSRTADLRVSYSHAISDRGPGQDRHRLAQAREEPGAPVAAAVPDPGRRAADNRERDASAERAYHAAITWHDPAPAEEVADTTPFEVAHLLADADAHPNADANADPDADRHANADPDADRHDNSGALTGSGNSPSGSGNSPPGRPGAVRSK
jgi:hypothetical protein